MTSSVSVYFDRIASNEAENDAVGGRGELLRRRGVHAHHDLSVVLHQTGAHHVQEVSLKHRLSGARHVQKFTRQPETCYVCSTARVSARFPQFDVQGQSCCKLRHI